MIITIVVIVVSVGLSVCMIYQCKTDTNHHQTRLLVGGYNREVLCGSVGSHLVGIGKDGLPLGVTPFYQEIKVNNSGLQ
jgi:hypothetical protein